MRPPSGWRKRSAGYVTEGPTCRPPHCKGYHSPNDATQGSRVQAEVSDMLLLIIGIILLVGAIGLIGRGIGGGLGWGGGPRWGSWGGGSRWGGWGGGWFGRPVQGGWSRRGPDDPPDWHRTDMGPGRGPDMGRGPQGPGGPRGNDGPDMTGFRGDGGPDRGADGPRRA